MALHKLKKSCQHTNTKDILMPDGYVHYGKKVCADCNKFITWIPNPANVQLRLERRAQIDKLINDCALSEWEKQFCESVKTSKFLTEKQTACFDRTLKKYGVN